MKKFSKIIACLSVLAMCISMLSLNAFADKNVKDSEALIQIAMITAQPGEQVEVDVIVSKNNIEYDYCNTSMEISYYSPLYLVDVEAGPALESLSPQIEYNRDKNSVLLTTEGDFNLKEGTIMYKLMFYIPGDMENGRYPIRFESISITGNNGDEVPPLAIDGDITVVCPVTTTYYTTTTYTTMPATTTNTTKPTTEIKESPVKPNISITRKHILYDEAYSGYTVTVNITLSGENVDNNYCNTGFRIMFPEDTGYFYYGTLTVAEDKDGNPDVKAGEAIEGLTSHVEWCTDENGNRNGIYLSTEGDGNKGKTGVMYKIKCKLPNFIGGGERFPISIEYQDGDCFTNYENDETGKLMQDYLFTKGITNGEIQIGFRTETATYTMPTTTRNTYTTYYTTTTTTSTYIGNDGTRTSTYTSSSGTIVTTEKPVQTTTSTTAKTTAPVVTGTGYENWTMFEDTIVSIGDDKVTFAERGKTAVMNNGSNMEKIKDAGVGSKVAVEAIVSPSGSILNIISIEVLEKTDVPTGDANGDGETSLADAVLIMQLLANPSEFSIPEDCAKAADVVNKGDGITPMDALAIQMLNINLIKPEDLPTTSEKLQSLVK